MAKRKSRKEVQREQAQRRESFVTWLQDRIETRRKAKLLAGEAEVVPAGHGVTHYMRHVRNSVPQEVLAKHVGANREERRSAARRGLPVPPRMNTPYVNPERDLRPGRRLRR